ncbi:MAG: hypothetical protein HQK75_14070 [Candidatus Magnetomorum sp.]|nr:hypothetical protein [Candidatus Magnetomorum sp.]
MIFLAFLKPIINGKGYDFKEVQISEEKRLDILIVIAGHQYVVELKIWRGQKAHEKGKQQLYEYLKIKALDKGWLIIFDFTQKGSKKWKTEKTTIFEKKIFAVWV